jgi:hypothetical protein
VNLTPVPAHPACTASSDDVPVTDAVSGVSLVMPHGWHWMLPGDPAWATIYGKDHEVEDQVKDGTMQGFALPLGTPDARLMSLAVYVVESEQSLPDQLAIAYADTVTRFEGHDFAGGEVVGLAPAKLPAGDAYRVEATMPYVGKEDPPKGHPTKDDRVAAYVLWNGGRAYFLVFRGNDDIFGDYVDEMACMADSLRLSEPSPSFAP